MIRKGIISKMLFAGMTLAGLAACSESYPGIDYDKTHGKDGVENSEEMSKTPVMVFVNEQDIFTVKTRGVGAFDNLDSVELYNTERLANSHFYVYAFRGGDYTSGPQELRTPTDFTRSIHNIPGHGPDTDNAHCLLDGSDYNYGMKMSLVPQGSGRFEYAEDGDGYFYSQRYEQVPYNFFAYYLDDIVPTAVNRRPESISYEVEIDGSQDLMAGYAPNLLEEWNKSGSYLAGIKSTLSESEIDAITMAGGYCTMAAHRGIHPTVNLEHKLAKLYFEAYPGDESSSNVTITDIVVKSKSKATFTVASRNLDDVGVVFHSDIKDLHLCELYDGEHNLQPLHEYTVPFEAGMDDVWSNRPPTRIGSSLLVAPSEEPLEMIITVRENRQETIGGTYRPHEYSLVYQLNPPSGKFDKGLKYKIQIVIFGLQQIEIYTNDIEKWKDGGEIPLPDPGDNNYGK